MAELFILFLTLTVFGAGVTLIDFLGVFDNIGENDNSGSNDDDSDAAAVSAKSGSNMIAEKKQESEKPGVKIVSRIMNVLRNIVYFSLGFGPTGLFASFSGLSRTSGLLWAFCVGAAMMILARLLKRLIRKDTDSSIKPDELLQEKGVLLLPLENGEISKAVIRQYGRETEIYVKCKDTKIKFPKGKEIIIEDYDNDVYWIKPAEDN
ncbi:MAG: hypothetical protein FWC17_07060 [Treponema sp.]|nr:hypothetical protein [Treponema sp.]